MLKPSDESQPLSWDEERDRIIGLGEHSQRKNYYPELRSNLSRLERFRTLLDLSGETILLVTLPEGRVVDANAAACELFDCPPETLIGKLLPDLGLAETTDVLALLNADAGAVTPVLHHREISLRKAETILPLDLSHRAALVDGTWFGVLLAHDARSRHAAEAQLRLAARVISDSSEGIIITDAESRIIDVNTTFEEITGYTLDEVRGKNPRLLSSGRQDKAFYQKMWQSINDTGAWRGELWNRRKNGEVFPEWLSLSAIRDEYGKVSHYVCVFTDVTEAKAREARIQHMAHHDFLTGLPNRILLIDRFRQAEAAAQRNDGRYALLFIDLDRFKNVNDTLGHTIGDQLLCDVASRLVGTVRATDTISRQGGDEFIILLSDIDSPETVAHVARKVMAALSNPSAWGDIRLRSRLPLASRSRRKMATTSTRCSSTPTWRCTTQSSRDATTTSSSGAK